MKKGKTIVKTLLITFISIIALKGLFPVNSLLPITSPPLTQHWLTVLLIPLDSRPPCTLFLQQLGEIAGIKIILPERELLDHYKEPGNTYALRNWLKAQSNKADAAIISLDMLIHGGLLSSRLSLGTSADIQQVLHLLSTIHKENPHIKLYAFNIIPRLLIADNRSNFSYQKNMLEYSILKDQIYTFENPEDIKKLTGIEAKVLPAIKNRYIKLYEQNMALNIALMDMVEKETLAGLVLGQDDGQAFGIANNNKQTLQYYVTRHSTISNKVTITRGTDEVALTILGRLINDFTLARPHIYVAYSHPEAQHIVMPFMPNTVGKTVAEKIHLAGGEQVFNPAEADFILFIHVGTPAVTKQDLQTACEQLADWIKKDYKIALVDLSDNFQINQTILPVLLEKGISIPSLIAYAGWNTTSNSIGTAITQASIFTQTLRMTDTSSKTFAAYQHNLEFLTARIIDDLYYQKDIYPFINKRLAILHIDPYNLGDHYELVSRVIQKVVNNQAVFFAKNSLYHRPIKILTNEGPRTLTITQLKTETSLPWQRTFEIQLTSTLNLALANN